MDNSERHRFIANIWQFMISNKLTDVMIAEKLGYEKSVITKVF